MDEVTKTWGPKKTSPSSLKTLTQEILLTDLQTPPDFKRIRKYLKEVHQREGLGSFIKAGWTEAELAEYARFAYLIPGKTHPTAASYQFIAETRPDSPIALAILDSLRKPGYVMPPFDRPEPKLKHYSPNDPDNPSHTPDIKRDVEFIARALRDQKADRLGTARQREDEPVSRRLWMRACQLRLRYSGQSLDRLLILAGL